MTLRSDIFPMQRYFLRFQQLDRTTESCIITDASMPATTLHFERKTAGHDIYITVKRDHRVCESAIYLAMRRLVNPNDIIGFLVMSFQFLYTITSLGQ